VYQLEVLTASVGGYLQHLVGNSLWLDIDGRGGWQADWTLFYWSWWISWSPFVGVFVARISYGRTVREFAVTVLLVPTAATFLWLAVFGGTALDLAVADTAFAEQVKGDAPMALHAMLARLPGESVTGVLATLLVVVFFITSSDSGSLVDDMVTSGGHPNPPRAQRVFWAVSEGAVAGTLLLAGGLQALRTASLTSGLAMAALLLVASYGLLRSLHRDRAVPGVPKRDKLGP
jgi:choline/glycine/proline betaine transport protein